MTTSFCFVFPGQGSQKVGMGKDFYDAFPVAREVFQEVDDALNEKLSTLIFEGPDTDLNLTANTQPAIMATSLAIFRTLEKEGGVQLEKKARYVAGHSLGEYSALAAAGTFSLADAARLLRLRGNAMQAACPPGEGGMAAILGLEMDEVEALAKDTAQGEVCACANDNSPGQIVISGHAAAIDRACALAKERGAKRALPLPVSAPFHCALMQPAADAMRDALEQTGMQTPMVPVYANVIAASERTPERIRDLLVQQVTGRVRWRESLLNMASEGITATLEIGVGNVLSGLTRRTVPDMAAHAVAKPADIEDILKVLG